MKRPLELHQISNQLLSKSRTSTSVSSEHSHKSSSENSHWIKSFMLPISLILNSHNSIDHMLTNILKSYIFSIFIKDFIKFNSIPICNNSSLCQLNILDLTNIRQMLQDSDLKIQKSSSHHKNKKRTKTDYQYFFPSKIMTRKTIILLRSISFLALFQKRFWTIRW